MRVPPPKELTKPLERRQSTEETPKAIGRRSIAATNRSSVITPALRSNCQTNTTKTEPKQAAKKTDDADAMKNKLASLEDEIRRLKRRIEELEKEIAELQKQIKIKDKRVTELAKDNDELKRRVDIILDFRCLFLMIHFFAIRNRTIKNKLKNFVRKILVYHKKIHIYKQKLIVFKLFINQRKTHQLN